MRILSSVSKVAPRHAIGCYLNSDARQRDTEIKIDPPGHADYTYQQKYGLRDYRGAVPVGPRDRDRGRGAVARNSERRLAS